MTTLEAARRYAKAGLSVIPIRTDGSKAAAVPWKQYQKRIIGESELRRYFGNAVGVAIVAGYGQLEILDFEQGAPFAEWLKLVSSYDRQLTETLVLVGTPSGGRHVDPRSAICLFPKSDGYERAALAARRWRSS